LEKDHGFDSDNPKILDKEKFYFKRLVSEMINIKSQKKALNIQSLNVLTLKIYQRHM